MLIRNRWSRALGVAALALAFSAVPVEPVAAAAAAEDGGSWLPIVAKVVNFSLLVGVLVYFLRAPIAGYLRSRGETIRRDLSEAAALRETAAGQLAEVEARLAALPGEIEALRQRGQEELAGERERLKDATARERERLLERARREIDLEYRLARRALVLRAAERAIGLSRATLERQMTPEDHARLVGRYVEGVRS